MYNFIDKLNRVHTKPVTEINEYPTNNAYTYSSYYKVLNPKKDYSCYLPETMPFGRHPGIISVPQSHDEITGVCILSQQKAKEICEYLENNYNQFCDLPGFKPKALYTLNPIKTIKAFLALNKEANPRKSVIKHPDTWNLAFWQRAEYRWLYKRAARINPSLYEKAYFLVARGISVLRWKKEEPDLLLYFSLEHLKQQNNLGIEGRIMRMYLNNVRQEMYESTEEMLRNYLDPKYADSHPWIIG